MVTLSLKNIVYQVSKQNIIDDVCIDIENGDCLSIVGASGSGKSTLLKICADLMKPLSGELFYRGKSYATYNPLILRQKISYCLQTPYLFGEDVYDNLKFPFEVRKEEVDRRRMITLLNRFDLQEDFLDKKIQGLSGGEKQRIALVRNLMYTPDILLLDEVTSALDEKNTKIVEAYIKELNKEGTTVLWITHNLEQSKGIFNKRITMESGKILNKETF